MKTLLLEIDESIYTQVTDFLKLLPEQQCHIIEPQQVLKTAAKPYDITSAFGLIKSPVSASLEEIEQGIIAGAIDDSD
ncbi:MAG: hypothetical protein Q8L68_05435 [Methylococcales bacterium]|nr:hypothetical protein [Methylococcales bacterium]